MYENSATVKSKRFGDVMWPRHYAALMEYCKRHGHCSVPSHHYYECELPGFGEDGGSYHYKAKLGVWLANQQQCYHGETGLRIRPEIQAKLQILVDQGNIDSLVDQSLSMHSEDFTLYRSIFLGTLSEESSSQ